MISPPKNLTPTRGNKQNASQKRGYYVEFKWGRLDGSIVPKWVKRKELKFTDSNEALKVVMKKLREKQGRGYLVG